jgi:hypothetical protein
VSGSCSLITCWQQLAPFREIGESNFCAITLTVGLSALCIVGRATDAGGTELTFDCLQIRQIKRLVYEAEIAMEVFGAATWAL